MAKELTLESIRQMVKEALTEEIQKKAIKQMKEEMKASYLRMLNEMNLFEEDVLLNEGDEEERNRVIALIDNDQWVRNNYVAFVNSLNQSEKKGFLSLYTVDELREGEIQTFQLKDYNIGFAIKPDGDIISVHNNSNVRGVGEAIIRAAIRNGGSKLDHFGTDKLNDLYSKFGFKETERYAFDDQYAHDWDYEKYGRPDVIYRRLEK